jgi:soluble lytic murein transglycosylase-like protein
MNSFLICMAALSLNLHNSGVICEYSDVILQESRENRLKPSLIIAVGRVESRWTPTAKSHANACGIMQVLPKYTKNPKKTCSDLQIPQIGIKVGAKKLNYWIYKYGKGNKVVGLCGYNAGFRCKGKNKNTTGLNYAKSVLKWERKFSKTLRREKLKYKNNSIFDYLMMSLKIIGDYK